MSQKSEAQILTDLQKIYSHLAESADRIDTLARRVEELERLTDIQEAKIKELAAQDGITFGEATPAPAKDHQCPDGYHRVHLRGETCPVPPEAGKEPGACDEPVCEKMGHAPPEAGKRWTLHQERPNARWWVCPYDPCPHRTEGPGYITYEVAPAAELDEARRFRTEDLRLIGELRDKLDAARQVSVNLRDRLEAAEAREKALRERVQQVADHAERWMTPAGETIELKFIRAALAPEKEKA